MSSNKEKDVLERQRELAARMAAAAKNKQQQQQRPSLLSSSSSNQQKKPPPPPSSSLSRGAGNIKPNSTSAIKTPSTLKVGGLTFNSTKTQSTQAQPQQHTRPNRKRKLNATTDATSSSSKRVATGDIIDLTKDDNDTTTGNKKSTTDGSKKILGIHKSYKRPSPAAALAAARAKAQQKADDGTTEDNTTTKDNNTTKKPGDDTTIDIDSTKLTRKGGGDKAFASLMQNVVAKTKDDSSSDPYASASFAANITPSDFWKNIRNWDFVSDLYKQQMENNNNFSKKNKTKDDKDNKDTTTTTSCQGS